MSTTAAAVTVHPDWRDHPIVSAVANQMPDADPATFLDTLSRYLGTLEDQFPGANFREILANGVERMTDTCGRWKPMNLAEHDAVLEIKAGATVAAAARKRGIPETRFHRLKKRGIL